MSMLRCDDCNWFYCTPFTRRRLCRLTFQEMPSENKNQAESCPHFDRRAPGQRDEVVANALVMNAEPGVHGQKSV